jgi:hypothetical protein
MKASTTTTVKKITLHVCVTWAIVVATCEIINIEMHIVGAKQNG